jgi:hypothetical protein
MDEEKTESKSTQSEPVHSISSTELADYKNSCGFGREYVHTIRVSRRAALRLAANLAYLRTLPGGKRIVPWECLEALLSTAGNPDMEDHVAIRVSTMREIIRPSARTLAPCI